MRYRELFTVFPREVSPGLFVYYYRTYSEDGRRTTARSTGKTSLTAAKQYCMKLWKEKALVPALVQRATPTLAEFSFDFWIHETSAYLKYRAQRGYVISKRHAMNQHRFYEVYIEPVLGKRRLDEITAPMVETWFLGLKDKGKAHQTCNQLLSNLRNILGEAMRRGLITSNPADAIKPLVKDMLAPGFRTTNKVG
jgi:hypothetical protein